MDRDTVKLCMDQVNKIAKAVEGLPYREAAPALRDLEELANLIGEELPGGYLCNCEACETPIGNDDRYGTDEEGECYFCESCFQQAIDAGMTTDAA